MKAVEYCGDSANIHEPFKDQPVTVDMILNRFKFFGFTRSPYSLRIFSAWHFEMLFEGTNPGGMKERRKNSNQMVLRIRLLALDHGISRSAGSPKRRRNYQIDGTLEEKWRNHSFMDALW